jgi:hypothetical protein
VGTSTSMEEFLANQARILENFSRSAPEATVRSGGLDDQSAIIVALRDPYAGDHAHTARKVPGAFPYSLANLHSTIGVRDMTKGSAAVLDIDVLRKLHGDSLEHLCTVISEVTEEFVAEPRDITLGWLETLCNQDSVIAASRKLTDGAFELRQKLLGAAEEASLPLNPAWGMHRTLARFKRELTGAELKELQQVLTDAPPVMGFSDLVFLGSGCRSGGACAEKAHAPDFFKAALQRCFWYYYSI